MIVLDTRATTTLCMKLWFHMKFICLLRRSERKHKGYWNDSWRCIEEITKHKSYKTVINKRVSEQGASDEHEFSRRRAQTKQSLRRHCHMPFAESHTIPLTTNKKNHKIDLVFEQTKHASVTIAICLIYVSVAGMKWVNASISRPVRVRVYVCEKRINYAKKLAAGTTNCW